MGFLMAVRGSQDRPDCIEVENMLQFTFLSTV